MQLTSRYLFPEGEEGHLKDIKTAFRGALRRGEIKDFRPHALRLHVREPLHDARGILALQVLGHKDIKMTMRYAHLSREFAKKEIQILDGLTSPQNGKASVAADASPNSCLSQNVTSSGPIKLL